jgi:hypothetical protein
MYQRRKEKRRLDHPTTSSPRRNHHSKPDILSRLLAHLAQPLEQRHVQVAMQLILPDASLTRHHLQGKLKTAAPVVIADGYHRISAHWTSPAQGYPAHISHARNATKSAITRYATKQHHRGRALARDIQWRDRRL